MTSKLALAIVLAGMLTLTANAQSKCILLDHITISSGFGTDPCFLSGNHTPDSEVIKLQVGVNPNAEGVIHFDSYAKKYWVCVVANLTTSTRTLTAGGTLNSVTIRNYDKNGKSISWRDNDILMIVCEKEIR